MSDPQKAIEHNPLTILQRLIAITEERDALRAQLVELRTLAEELYDDLVAEGIVVEDSQIKYRQWRDQNK